MKIGIVGISGRMGREVARLLSPDEVSGGISKGSTDLEIGYIFKNSSVIIDFSTPSASIKVARFCEEYKVPLVCGTTGLDEEDFKKLKKYAENTAILYSSNFSIGIALMSQLIRKSESILEGFDVSIIERHHSGKKDKPSGTALFLASQLKNPPQVVSLRIGGVPGDHICSFTSDDEEITISHRSFNRRVFAKGAIKCANWLVSQKNGFYSLRDYLDGQR